MDSLLIKPACFLLLFNGKSVITDLCCCLFWVCSGFSISSRFSFSVMQLLRKLTILVFQLLAYCFQYYSFINLCRCSISVEISQSASPPFESSLMFYFYLKQCKFVIFVLEVRSDRISLGWNQVVGRTLFWVFTGRICVLHVFLCGAFLHLQL